MYQCLFQIHFIQDMGDGYLIICTGHLGFLGVKSSKTQWAVHMASKENREMQNFASDTSWIHWED